MQDDLFNPTLRQKFEEFHNNNPEVYQQLVKLALDLKRKGRARYGIKGLFEVVRWHRAMSTTANAGFKLNNNHTAYYARMIMDNWNELDGFFHLRKVGS